MIAPQDFEHFYQTYTPKTFWKKIRYSGQNLLRRLFFPKNLRLEMENYKIAQTPLEKAQAIMEVMWAAQNLGFFQRLFGGLRRLLNSDFNRLFKKHTPQDFSGLLTTSFLLQEQQKIDKNFIDIITRHCIGLSVESINLILFLDTANLLTYDNCKNVVIMDSASGVYNYCNKNICQILKELKLQSSLLTPEYAQSVFDSLSNIFKSVDEDFIFNFNSVFLYLNYGGWFNGEDGEDNFALFVSLKEKQGGSIYKDLHSIFKCLYADMYLKALKAAEQPGFAPSLARFLEFISPTIEIILTTTIDQLLDLKPEELNEFCNKFYENYQEIRVTAAVLRRELNFFIRQKDTKPIIPTIPAPSITQFSVFSKPESEVDNDADVKKMVYSF